MLFSSIVTKSHLKDFLVMAKSLKIYQPSAVLHVACDNFCFDYLDGNFSNVIAYLNGELIEGNHVSGDESSGRNFEKDIRIKFEHSLSLLKKYGGPIVWCDVDHIFINSFDDKILNLCSQVDACITPHSTNDSINEATVGFFNCGFALINSITFLEHWHDLFKQKDSLGLYFEQKPLEIAVRRFVTVNLPINYNVGWWRFLKCSPENHAQNLMLTQNPMEIKLYNLPVINFHFHLFKKGLHSIDAQKYENMLLVALKSRARECDVELLTYIEAVRRENF